jgi:hypothetical protein
MPRCCCNAAESEKEPPRTLLGERLAWILSTALLVAVPKCPACLAAHVAVWTGLGLSFSTATYLRWTMLAICVAVLAVLITKRIGSLAFRTR